MSSTEQDLIKELLLKELERLKEEEKEILIREARRLQRKNVRLENMRQRRKGHKDWLTANEGVPVERGVVIVVVRQRRTDPPDEPEATTPPEPLPVQVKAEFRERQSSWRKIPNLGLMDRRK